MGERQLRDCFKTAAPLPWLRDLSLEADFTGQLDNNMAALRAFRMPVLDITKLNCTPSPFTDAPLLGPRERVTAWGGALTRCGDDKTRCARARKARLAQT